MSLPLDQLRTQRELVKRHLDWLDAQIAGATGAEVPDRPVSASKPEVVPSATAPIDPVAVVASPEVLLEVHATPDEGITQGAKYGCIAIAVAVVLGFLFVLFVLPRFLYGDKKDRAPVENPSSGEYQPAATPPAGGVR